VEETEPGRTFGAGIVAVICLVVLIVAAIGIWLVVRYIQKARAGPSAPAATASEGGASNPSEYSKLVDDGPAAAPATTYNSTA